MDRWSHGGLPELLLGLVDWRPGRGLPERLLVLKRCLEVALWGAMLPGHFALGRFALGSSPEEEVDKRAALLLPGLPSEGAAAKKGAASEVPWNMKHRCASWAVASRARNWARQVRTSPSRPSKASRQPPVQSRQPRLVARKVAKLAVKEAWKRPQLSMAPPLPQP